MMAFVIGFFWVMGSVAVSVFANLSMTVSSDSSGVIVGMSVLKSSATRRSGTASLSMRAARMSAPVTIPT